MFDLLLVIVVAAVLYHLFDKPRTSSEEFDEETQRRVKQIESLEVEIDNINGVWYCWSKDPEEGYSFVGQHEDRDVLSQLFIDYAKVKYNVS